MTAAMILDEVTGMPTELPQTAEYQITEENAKPLAEECCPAENRTFPFEQSPSSQKNAAGKSKTNRMKTAAAILAAAGITISAGLLGTTVNLAMRGSDSTAAVEATESQSAETEAPTESLTTEST